MTDVEVITQKEDHKIISTACPCCGSKDYSVRMGIQKNKSGIVQRWKCKECGYRFNQKNILNPKSNPTLMIEVTDLSLRKISTRTIADHISIVYGYKMDHVTVARWVKRSMRLLEEIAIGHMDSPSNTWNNLNHEERHALAVKAMKHSNSSVIKKARARLSELAVSDIMFTRIPVNASTGN